MKKQIKPTLIVDADKISRDMTETTKKEISFDISGISSKLVKEVSIPVNVIKSAGEKDKIISVKSDDISIKLNSKDLLTL